MLFLQMSHQAQYLTHNQERPGRTSLVAQWLRLHTPSAEGPGLIPDQGTRSHMTQL